MPPRKMGLKIARFFSKFKTPQGHSTLNFRGNSQTLCAPPPSSGCFKTKMDNTRTDEKMKKRSGEKKYHYSYCVFPYRCAYYSTTRFVQKNRKKKEGNNTFVVIIIMIIKKNRICSKKNSTYFSLFLGLLVDKIRVVPLCIFLLSVFFNIICNILSLIFFFRENGTLDFHSKNRLVVVNGDPFSPFHYFPLFCAFSQSKMFCKKSNYKY